jgi:isoquinoline 1-oxidoreductase beta subunit
MEIAAVDGMAASLGRMLDAENKRKLVRAAMNGMPPYAIPNVTIEAVHLSLPLRVGYMRGSPEREHAFFTESFIDELAHAAGLEPLAFRMSMLGQNGRLARCLQGAARLAGWDGGGPGSTMGLAGWSAFGSHIGLVASARIDSDQRVKVDRLVAAVDCGRAVNTGLIAQQIEAGLIWALAQATMPSPEWIAGMPRARTFGALGLPRLGETPQIIVEIIPSSAPPGGISGLGTTVLAPGVANAIHAASGKRMRTLPFDPMAGA